MYKFAILAHEGASPETILKAERGSALPHSASPWHCWPNVVSRLRAGVSVAWKFSSIPPGPGRLRDWLRGPPLVREIY